MRTRIHRQILTEAKTFSFYHSTFLTRVTDVSHAPLRDMRFLALCSSSARKTMSAKATATAARDWKDPEAEVQAPGPHAISAPSPVPPSPPHDPHQLPPHGYKAGWKAKVGKGGKEIILPAAAYKDDAETPIKYWWDHPDGMWLQTFRFMVVHFMSFSCKMRAFSSYLFFVLRKRVTSPLSGTSPGMSPVMPALVKNNATNSNHKRNQKKKEKRRKKKLRRKTTTHGIWCGPKNNLNHNHNHNHK